MELIESDWSSIEGTECYCSSDAAAEIRSRIAEMPLRAAHYLGTGDFHYQSLFWLERIGEPFTLMLFDNHPDNQEGAFGDELLSCGGWVLKALELPMLKGMIWFDGDGKSHQVRRESEGAGAREADASDGSGRMSLPVYLSIDLDILSEEFAHTNWNQGNMSIDELEKLVRSATDGRRLLGADFCGGRSAAKGGSPEDSVLNRRAIARILRAFP